MNNFDVFGGRFGEELVCLSNLPFETTGEAIEAAYQHAIKIYDANPYKTIEDIMLEEDVTKEEATEIYEEQREEYIDYYVINLDEADEDEEDEEDEDEDWTPWDDEQEYEEE